MKGLIIGKAQPLCELAGIADTTVITKVGKHVSADSGWHGANCG